MSQNFHTTGRVKHYNGTNMVTHATPPVSPSRIANALRILTGIRWRANPDGTYSAPARSEDNFNPVWGELRQSANLRYKQRLDASQDEYGSYTHRFTTLEGFDAQALLALAEQKVQDTPGGLAGLMKQEKQARIHHTSADPEAVKQLQQLLAQQVPGQAWVPLNRHNAGGAVLAVMGGSQPLEAIQSLCMACGIEATLQYQLGVDDTTLYVGAFDAKAFGKLTQAATQQVPTAPATDKQHSGMLRPGIDGRQQG